MTEALVLALGVPTALVAACLLWRRRWPQAFADIRGIALQTVIVIVVMLVIAGGVAGVLLSRGGEAIGHLEAQSVGSVTATNCPTIDLRDEDGTTITGALGTGGAINTCVWAGTAGKDLDTASQVLCRSFGGAAADAAANKCTGVNI